MIRLSCLEVGHVDLFERDQRPIARSQSAVVLGQQVDELFTIHKSQLGSVAFEFDSLTAEGTERDEEPELTLAKRAEQAVHVGPRHLLGLSLALNFQNRRFESKLVSVGNHVHPPPSPERGVTRAV